jgi:uncharacterized DUF497 family protein
MARTTYNFESLDRHGVSVGDADDVLMSDTWKEMPPTERGNERLMFVGFTSNGRLIEAGVEYFDDEDREHVFHANDVTDHYKQVFERGMKS